MTVAESKDYALPEEAQEHVPAPGPKQASSSDLWSVLSLTIPFVVTTSAKAVMDVVDYALVTRLYDSAAQAAILPAQMIMYVPMVFGMGVVSMVATFASQSLGRKDASEAAAYVWQSAYFSLLFMAVGVAMLPFVDSVVAWFGHEPAVQVREREYAIVGVLTIGPAVLMNALSCFFNGIHKPSITMWSALEANVVNVVLSFFLMFPQFTIPVIGTQVDLGFNSMGIAGAAWGTFWAIVYRCVRLMYVLLSGHYARTFATRTTWMFSLSRFQNLLRVGIPTGFHFVSNVAVWTFFVTVLIGHKFGQDHLIATSTVWQYLRISVMPVVGVGFALTALVGKAIGERDFERAMRDTRTVLWMTVTAMGLLSTVYIVFASQLIAVFNDTPEVVRIGQAIMICMAAFQLFDAVTITYECALRGAGDTFWPTTFFIVSHWVIVIGGGYVMIWLFPQLGSVGPWISASLLIAVCAVFGYWRWNSRVWMRLDIFAKKRPLDDAEVADPTVDLSLGAP